MTHQLNPGEPNKKFIPKISPNSKFLNNIIKIEPKINNICKIIFPLIINNAITNKITIPTDPNELLELAKAIEVSQQKKRVEENPRKAEMIINEAFDMLSRGIETNVVIRYTSGRLKTHSEFTKTILLETAQRKLAELNELKELAKEGLKLLDNGFSLSQVLEALKTKAKHKHSKEDLSKAVFILESNQNTFTDQIKQHLLIISKLDKEATATNHITSILEFKLSAQVAVLRIEKEIEDPESAIEKLFRKANKLGVKLASIEQTCKFLIDIVARDLESTKAKVKIEEFLRKRSPTNEWILNFSKDTQFTGKLQSLKPINIELAEERVHNSKN